jgi:hypothetical protein
LVVQRYAADEVEAGGAVLAADAVSVAWSGVCMWQVVIGSEVPLVAVAACTRYCTVDRACHYSWQAANPPQKPDATVRRGQPEKPLAAVQMAL